MKDTKEREKNNKLIAEKENQLKNDRIWLLHQPQFQRVMADILEKGGIFNSVMTGSSMTFYKSGKQDFARQIWAEMADANLELGHELLKPKFLNREDSKND